MRVSDFAAELSRSAAEARGQRSYLAGSITIPDEARLWLAVTPAWTLALAEAVGFPHGTMDVKEVFSAMREEGLCDVHTDPLGPDTGRERFSIAPAARAGVLEEAAEESSVQPHEVGVVVGTIARRVREAMVPPEAIPPLLHPWAELARHAPDLQAVGRALASKIDESLASDSVEPQRPDKALSWIEAARPLGDVLGGLVTAAIQQQERRVDLVYRQREDERHLDRFLLRDEPSAAFERLIAGPDNEWALHFVGTGGVGKTMLLRYISGRWARLRGAATSRIDFDYINPEFPTRAPALLLGHLMQGLRLHAGQTAHRSFAHFEAKMLTLHERARAAEPGRAAVADGWPELAWLIEEFASAVSELPRPVVFLLDTCEELAKVRFAGEGLADNVAATFRILEPLHDRVPWIRVVFCGRRPLAGGGLGWSLPGCSYPKRPYLALFELRGFTRQEGLAYLAQSPPVAADLVDPILDANRDATPTMGFVCADEPGEPQPARYSPFGLSLYAGWVREDGTLRAETIRAGDIDPYIQTRILGRIRRPALTELMPALAAVGRVDRPLLRALSTRPEPEFDEAVRELREQDWVVAQEEGFFELRPHLRQRLWKYLRGHGRAVSGEMRARAGAYLERVTIEEPLNKLSVSYFDAAVRLLASDAARACAWWERVEGRFALSSEFAWARRLVESLLSEEGAAGERGDGAELLQQAEHPLRPAILATNACLLMQLGEPTRLDSLWREVEANATRDPRPAGARLLILRARAGRVVAAWLSGQPLHAEVLSSFVATVGGAARASGDERATVSVIAAFEALVEMTERSEADGGLADWRSILDAFASGFQGGDRSLELAGFTAALAARAAHLAQDAVGAQHWWKRALAGVANLGRRPIQVWLDWRAPEDLAARVRLEFAVAASPAVFRPNAALRRLHVTLGRPISIDADRLAAAVMRLGGAERPPTTDDLSELALAGGRNTGAPEWYNAHRRVAPLCVESWSTVALAYGAVNRAMKALRGELSQLERRSSAFESSEAVVRAQVAIARRMRMRDEEHVSLPPLEGAVTPDTLEALHGLLAFDARSDAAERLATVVPPAEVAPMVHGGWLHRHWRTIPATTARDARFAVDWAAKSRLAEAASSDPSLACELDAIEANRIAADHHESLPFPSLPSGEDAMAKIAWRAGRWIAATPLAPAAHLRLLLRVGALGHRDARTEKEIGELAQRCGVRHAAVIALDEGELLALRLPGAGAWVLAYAHVWFAQSRDFAGSVTAACCRALAAVRAERSPEATSAITEARRAYARLARRGSQRELVRFMMTKLPDWTDLRRIAERPTFEDLDVLPADDWRPWLVRIIAVLAWEFDGKALGRRSVMIGSWIETRYGVTDTAVAGGRRLPPELACWGQHATEREETRSAARGEEPVTVTIASLREVGTRTIRVGLSVESPRGRRLESMQGVLDWELPYRVAETRCFDAAETVLWVSAFPWETKRIDLLVDQRVANGGWEALIARWLVHTRFPHDRAQSEAAERSLCFVRRPPRRRGGSRDSAMRVVHEVAIVVAESALARSMGSLWSSELKPYGGEYIVITNLIGRPEISAKVAHIVGSPVTTAHGDLALQLDSGGSDEAQVVYSSSSPERGGVFLRTGDIRQIFHTATAIVLQARPTFGSERTASDQESAAMLRSMAADLAAGGIPCVATIPPLPFDHALACLQQFSRALLRGTQRESPLIAAVEAAQAAAREGGFAAEEDRRDAAWDFCLYLA